MSVEPFEFIDIGNIKAEPEEYDDPVEDPLATVKEEKTDELNFSIEHSGLQHNLFIRLAQNINKLSDDVKPKLNDVDETRKNGLNDQNDEQVKKQDDDEHCHLYREENRICRGSNTFTSNPTGNIDKLENVVKTETIDDEVMRKTDDDCKVKGEDDDQGVEETVELKVFEHNPMYEDNHPSKTATSDGENVGRVLVDGDSITEEQQQTIQINPFREQNSESDNNNLNNANVQEEMQNYEHSMITQGGYPQQNEASTSAALNNNERYSCNSCNYKCNRKGDLKTHISTLHDKVKRYCCNFCNYKCNRRANLKAHKLDVHSEEKPFLCELCPFKSKLKGSLTRHISHVHFKQVLYSCQFCNKSFSQKHHLKSHVSAVHNKETPHSCQLCSYKCNQKQNLKIHISTVHLKQLLYSCPSCNKGFSQKKNVISHISAVHYKETPHSCQYCPYKSNQKQNLKKHISTVHFKETRFNCQQCNYKCNQRGHLTRHISAVHSKEKNINL